MKTVALLGNPNVGKSVLFYHLTGKYVTVSNYPGTTVEISRGLANLYGKTLMIYDTPGMYSLSPVTEEEAVTRRLLMENPPDVVVHVVDAKNLPRMLPLTLELMDCGFPVILVLNMMDEAEKLGVRIHVAELATRLGIPVLEASFVEGRGTQMLKRKIRQVVTGKKVTPPVQGVSAAVQRLGQSLKENYSLPKTMIARFLLEEDREITSLVQKKEGRSVVEHIFGQQDDSLQYHFAMQRHQQAEQILSGIFTMGTDSSRGWLDRFTLNPLGGFLVTAMILYVGLYLLVGRFGAGTLVDLLEGTLLGQIIIPQLVRWVEAFLPWQAVQELLAGEFGVLTLGFRYAFGIILPIVGTFFFVFAVLEDTGYLPRLAYWVDQYMAKMGLNGRAVIPLTLGLGCGTMAVLVTRTLESVRERFIATFLLALAIPCSAQLGLILALLSAEPAFLLIWVCVVGAIFLFAGQILHAVLPGSRPPFFMELPPLRFPSLNAIFQKTLARMRWYFLEIIPVFLVVSLVLFTLGQLGQLDRLATLLAPLLGRMGLPDDLSLVFLYGFFRRDYGAAGLFDLYRGGFLDGAQLLVAAVVLTLFFPCLAQLGVMIRERGIAISLLILLLVSILAFGTGLLLSTVLGLATF
ncbi:ferrous iron transport protein B [Dethiobacter alkaliphilus]|uniref:ferrous iron transport protein B n=1 Tax=Dethiobacter alkaliphilus TaxID=427926 RepID=UPI0022278627|nr:ferrous iron transport protein B [Dethiobacter alkaliphilus]MCW3489141.1 ferrous iron transport protein B [Dethiobacter alkaliphilus]